MQLSLAGIITKVGDHDVIPNSCVGVKGNTTVSDHDVIPNSCIGTNPVVIADQYLANDIPIADQTVFTLPIHQKTENFTLRLFNDSPFPVSLNSMMWEGIYSPRFYRRT